MFGLMSFAGAFILNIIKNFAHKPIIYIYPEEEIEVEVKVSNPEKFTCTYPKYKDSWKVLAKPTGDLVDIETGKKLYSLYWEGLNTTKPNYKEGFIVKGEEVATFLEEKLEILGLNEREKEEFIACFGNEGFEEDGMQIQSILRGKQELETAMQELDKTLTSRCRLAISLGTMSGLLLVVLFL